MRQTAIKAAKAAGKILLTYYKKPKSKTHAKGKYDVGADADYAAENKVISIIEKAYPKHNIVAEESGDHLKGSEYTWYVDALDGTVNFTKRIPIWGVSIGLTRNGKPILGVVFDPIRNELFVGQAGKKTTLNGKPIRVTSPPSLAKCQFATDYTTKENYRKGWFRMIKKLENVYGMRVFHCTCLAAAWTACGRIDAYVRNAAPYDNSTYMQPLLEGAGGKVFLQDPKKRSMLIAGHSSILSKIKAKVL